MTAIASQLQPLPQMALMQRIVTFLIVTVLLSACTKMVPLQTNLKDADANEIVHVLTRNGIDVQKQRDKEGVTVTGNGFHFTAGRMCG